ncbi:MAG: hypothetical protein HC899_39260 [Leptolyngbyaceae cyanobacterium SM1_4_3]|nr:hypothetical protein [Leptolyngbyaceae cyanobacterium SM1_4_3]
MAEDKTKNNNTRFDVFRDPVKDTGVDFLPTGYEGATSEDYTIPSCTIEDVDIAVFDLFDKKIGFSQYESEIHENDQVTVVKRKPYVIYAIGERFALTKKLKPLRDKKKQATSFASNRYSQNWYYPK